MDTKRRRKSTSVQRNLKWTESGMSSVALITENVFVPITKSVFNERREPPTLPYNFSPRNIQVVESSRCNVSLTASLLRKPFSPKQISETNTRIASRLIDKHPSRIFPNDRSDSRSPSPSRSRARASESNGKRISFPSSISDLPFACRAKSHSFSIDRNPAKGKKRRGTKTNGNKSSGCNKKLTIDGVTPILLGFSNGGGGGGGGGRGRGKKLFKSNEPKSVTRRAQNYSKQIEKNISSSWVGSRSNSSSSVRATTTVRKANRKDSVGSNGYSDQFFETDQAGMYALTDSREQTDRSRSIVEFFRKHDTRLEPRKHHRYQPCRIKYSWQAIGTSSQTSSTLLESLAKENGLLGYRSICDCSIKYSWQIIGIATQTSSADFTGIAAARSFISSFSPGKVNSNRRNIQPATTDQPSVATVWRRGKRFILLNTQHTQTFAHKQSQTIFTEFYKKYIV